ncbi:MAG: DUF4132 domain-containing protein [Rhodocyclaceae bacterium]|nr:DUF4132 domain-containing protein [Rhodocyclaceae bacterium]
MLQWIRSLFSGGQVELPAGVPAAWFEGVAKFLEPLDKLEGGAGRAGLARDALAFVLNGEPMAVLGEASQNAAIGEKLGVSGWLSREDLRTREAAIRASYAVFDELAPAVALRWARFIEACAASQRRNFKLALPLPQQWLEVLLLHARGDTIQSLYSVGDAPGEQSIGAAQIEAMLAVDGANPATLWIAGFASDVTSGYGVDTRAARIRALRGYAEALARHLDALRPLLAPAAVPQRLHVLNMLAPASGETLSAIAPQLAALATSSSKQVRALAEPLLTRCDGSALPALQAIVQNGKPDQRAQALRLVEALGRRRDLQSWLDYARDTAAADKAPSVQALLQEWASAAQSSAATAALPTCALPVIDWSAAANRVPPGALERFCALFNAMAEKFNADARAYHAASAARGASWRLHLDALLDGANRQTIAACLERDGPPGAEFEGKPVIGNLNTYRYLPVLQKFAAEPGLTLPALLKLLAWFGKLRDGRGEPDFVSLQCVDALHRAGGRPSLLELEQTLAALNIPGERLFRAFCTRWGNVFAAWPDADLWPFFARHLELLLRELNGNTIKDYAFNRDALFRAAASFPVQPPQLVNALFGLALSGGKSDRSAAQEALARHPGKEARILAALADGRAETRATAAQWLARLRHAAAVPALAGAVVQEKHDLAKGAMLDALQALGEPVERYLDRAALAADAKKGLAKDLPKELHWFPWQALPALHWADTGEPMGEAVARWLLVQAVRQKSPEPGAVLRKYCAALQAHEREQFGQFILETWLNEDTLPITPAAAMTQARNQAQSSYQSMQQYPQSYQNDPRRHMTVEQLTAVFLPALLKTPQGSAIGSKGLLAVAAACCGARAAAPVQRYLKEYFGTRAAQGRALIAMLAWVEHPTATQLMLAIGGRFRTKSFQEEATRQAELLAERKGWTLAELADRTIPAAGFDDTGTLDLNFGLRSFTARLLPDFKIELFDPEGKKIAALPEPRQDDDAEAAAGAKKALSSAKKEIKSIVAMQAERLYEALCTQRAWPVADWRDYLQQHPVLRHLVQRLLWVVVEDDKVVQVFRPLGDGSLTDCDDNPLELPAAGVVRLAHDTLLDAGQIAGWQQHFADYEIEPPFQQLGKGAYTLPYGKGAQDEIDAFKGHVLETFALRGRAGKLGYARGTAEDGGWFYTYEKRFPTLGLTACLEFTGNGLPEENRKVALLSAWFAHAAAGDNWNRKKLPLAKVPPVLLSECYQDLRLIAAEGSGYDPDWEKTSSY